MDNEPVWANPDLRPNPIWLRWLKRISFRRELRIFAITSPFVLALCYWVSRADEDGAKVVLADTLEAPSSANYISFETVAKEGDWKMVHVVLDAQNSFGAMLRKSLCVTYRFEDGHYKWLHDEGVQECGKPPSAEEIALLKRLNGWPGVQTASAD